MLCSLLPTTLLFVMAACTPACRGRPAGEEEEADSEETRARALEKLLEVFGMPGGPPQLPHQPKQPPQYMLDLYNAVAGDDGITKDPDALEGNTVRSFFEKTHSERHLLFLLSSVAKTEVVLTAELHLFKLRARAGPEGGLLLRRQHFCQVSVYQVLDQDRMDSPEGKKLLSARLLATHGSGWEVFAITQAVRDWTEEESSNRGLLVTVRGLGGGALGDPTVHFASGRDHHESKKPMLVLFTDDGRRGTVVSTDPSPEVPRGSPLALLPPTLAAGPKSNRSRVSRSAEGGPLRPCQRYPLSVDFEEIGWTSWIISPRKYSAYHCLGSCPFPLGDSLRPTNHATVLSILNALRISPEVREPCCVPDEFYSINLLYFDDHENVVLKQFHDMVAGNCGCH